MHQLKNGQQQISIFQNLLIAYPVIWGILMGANIHLVTKSLLRIFQNSAQWRVFYILFDVPFL